MDGHIVMANLVLFHSKDKGLVRFMVEDGGVTSRCDVSASFNPFDGTFGKVFSEENAGTHTIGEFAIGEFNFYSEKYYSTKNLKLLFLKRSAKNPIYLSGILFIQAGCFPRKKGRGGVAFILNGGLF